PYVRRATGPRPLGAMALRPSWRTAGHSTRSEPFQRRVHLRAVLAGHFGPDEWQRLGCADFLNCHGGHCARDRLRKG
ncbi:hypothetical protein OE165_28640, partial [Escherichia coli]|uniref:hypothetical protein n=1 Tax=Escherichia coli TaxID=562 RepID=UPI0021F303B9